jgi:hypothetical protein
MNSNSFIVLLIVCVTIQITSAKNVAPRDSFDDTMALLIQIHNDALAPLNNAMIYTGTDGRLELHSHSIITKENGFTEITKVSDEQLAALDQIKNAAAELGLDITSCLGDTESLLSQLVEIDIENIDKCVDGQENNILYNFNSTARKVFNTFTEIFYVTDLLKSCEATDEVCISNVVNIIRTDTIHIPDEIDQERIKMENTQNQGMSFITECIVTYVRDIKDKGKSILKTIRECISILGHEL